jgi:hypothetical protein
LLQYLMVGFYFFAGLLKLNQEWLSGRALYGITPIGVPPSLVPLSCVYVVALELLLVFGIWARSRVIFCGVLVQLVMFHIASWSVVGFLYPTMMLALLSIFPLTRWASPVEHERASLRLLLAGKDLPRTYGVLAGFAALQLVPHLFPGSSALTGEGRMFALHMFDAPVECQATAQSHGPARSVVTLHSPRTPERVRCDPLLVFQIARRLCDQPSLRKHDFDLSLKSWRAGERKKHTIIAVPQFCAAGIQYRLWRHNDWIQDTVIE